MSEIEARAKFPTGRMVQVFTGEIHRSDTSSKDLFTLPTDSVIVGGTLNGMVASNASSTATVSVGVKGLLGTEFLSAYDVKTSSTGLGLTVPNWQKFGATNSNTLTIGSNSITVTGKYAETGNASDTGGPWVVTFHVLTV